MASANHAVSTEATGRRSTVNLVALTTAITATLSAGDLTTPDASTTAKSPTAVPILRGLRLEAKESEHEFIS